MRELIKPRLFLLGVFGTFLAVWKFWKFFQFALGRFFCGVFIVFESWLVEGFKMLAVAHSFHFHEFSLIIAQFQCSKCLRIWSQSARVNVELGWAWNGGAACAKSMELDRTVMQRDLRLADLTTKTFSFIRFGFRAHFWTYTLCLGRQRTLCCTRNHRRPRTKSHWTRRQVWLWRAVQSREHLSKWAWRWSRKCLVFRLWAGNHLNPFRLLIFSTFLGGQAHEDFVEIVQREAENAESLEGFIMSHSVSGGTGSGFGSSILETLRDA